MAKTISEINKAFGGRLIGNPKVKTIICEIVATLPKNLIEYITNNVWFLSSPEDAWAITFRGSDIYNHQHLIFLSHELFNEDSSQIEYTTLHEIGHVILGHKNSIGRKQTQSEIDKQEFEADQFARKYLT